MNRYCIQTVLIAVLIFALMFALNYFMPMHRDDYDYAMIWHTGVHITAFADVFDSLLRARRAHGHLLFPRHAPARGQGSL